MADPREPLTQKQAYWLQRIIDGRQADGEFERYVLPDDMHDGLVEQGYIRWDHGVLFVTDAGLVALARQKA